jgi:hypothetical protein
MYGGVGRVPQRASFTQFWLFVVLVLSFAVLVLVIA